MELVVYKASAGSGKTFTLAVEYISLLIKNPQAYQQILAVTFTNKATAEMKERILTHLYGIWRKDPASEPYLQEIARRTGMDKEKIREKTHTALMYLIHDYNRFGIQTIDRFFQSVLKNMARELDLSPHLDIELNTSQVISDAVDSMMEKLEPNSPTLHWILTYIGQRISENKRWSISKELKDFAKYIFDENYILMGKELRRLMEADKKLVGNYRQTVFKLQEEAENVLKGYGKRFSEALERNGLVVQDLSRGQTGIAGTFKKLEDGRWGDVKTDSATYQDCLNDSAKWISASKYKGDPEKKERVLAVVEESLLPLLKELDGMLPEKLTLINSCMLSTKHLNQLNLLTEIDGEVKELNRQMGRFILSDTHAMLHEVIKDSDASFVFEKIGARLRNIMIDEFQDTSRMQWDNFKMLLAEGLSNGEDSLIVGDVKQSIYRWRNGDWAILNDLNEKEGFMHGQRFKIREVALKVNRRSETNVIRFTGELFMAAVEWLNGKNKEETGLELEALKRAYMDVKQESPKAVARGFVSIEKVKEDEETDYTQGTLKQLGEKVLELQEKGVKLSDMAILIRKNKSIPLIASYFENELKIKVVSNEAFRLDAAVSTNMLVDALRVMSNPQDMPACAALVANYQQFIGKQWTNPHEWFTLSAEEGLPKEFLESMDRLRMMPLYEQLEELYRLLHLDRIEAQDAYLLAFFDAVTEYLTNHPSDVDSFIAYWDETLCEKTIPGGEVEGVKIFSIHKSKGLEFHTVLIPFCDWEMEVGAIEHLVWCRPTVEPFDKLPLVPVSYSKMMANSIYQEDFKHERLQLWIDNLNLLYVALTRAEKNMFLFIKDRKPNSISEVISESLEKTCEKLEVSYNPEVPFTYGELCPSSEKKVEAKEVSVNKLTQKPEKEAVRMCSMEHVVEFRQSNQSAAFIRGEEDGEINKYELIQRGQLLHALFSEIGTVDDIDGAIDHLEFEGVLGSREEVENLRRFAHEVFNNDQVKDWYSGRWRLFNECSIIYMKDGRLETRRPDRVMMDGQEVVVVDFKFAKPNGKYNKQVEQYMSLLREMGYDHVSGYLWYVDEDKIERV